MKKVMGSHTTVDSNGQNRTMAVLECGHEVDYREVKWPEAIAECPVKEHDADGKAIRPEGAPAPAAPTAPLPPDQTGPQ